MKNFFDLSKQELWKLRNEIVLGSLFTTDYKNTFGFKPSCVGDFFDGYEDYICELIDDCGLPYSDEEFSKRDNEDTLYDWFNCYDDLSWIEVDESEITRYEVETIYKSGVKRTEIISDINEDEMWKFYDKHHDAKKIESSAIVDAW